MAGAPTIETITEATSKARRRDITKLLNNFRTIKEEFSERYQANGYAKNKLL